MKTLIFLCVSVATFSLPCAFAEDSLPEIPNGFSFKLGDGYRFVSHCNFEKGGTIKVMGVNGEGEGIDKEVEMTYSSPNLSKRLFNHSSSSVASQQYWKDHYGDDCGTYQVTASKFYIYEMYATVHPEITKLLKAESDKKLEREKAASEQRDQLALKSVQHPVGSNDLKVGDKIAPVVSAQTKVTWLDGTSRDYCYIALSGPYRNAQSVEVTGFKGEIVYLKVSAGDGRTEYDCTGSDMLAAKRSDIKQWENYSVVPRANAKAQADKKSADDLARQKRIEDRENKLLEDDQEKPADTAPAR
jgi:hypothetical protein